MSVIRLISVAGLILPVFASLMITVAPTAAADDITAMLDAAGRLHKSGKLVDAERQARATVVAAQDSAQDYSYALTLLAGILEDQEQYAEAELHSRTVVRMVEADGGNDAFLATALTNLGQVLVFAGKTAEAKPVLDRALEVASHRNGADDRITAAVLCQLSRYYRLTNQPDRALPLARRGFAALQYDASANPHPLVDAGAELGLVYQSLARYSAAAEQYRRVLTIIEPDCITDPVCPISQAGLGASLVALGKPLEGLRFLKMALQSVESRLGPNAASLAPILSNLAVAYYHVARPEDAENAVRRCLAILNDGRLDSSYVASLQILARIHRYRGQNAEAKAVEKRAQGIVRELNSSVTR